jgi:hypothetical protein
MGKLLAIVLYVGFYESNMILYFFIFFIYLHLLAGVLVKEGVTGTHAGM